MAWSLSWLSSCAAGSAVGGGMMAVIAEPARLDLHGDWPNRASGQHLVRGWLQDAVQAAQDRERQDHVAVLVGLVGTAQQVGDLPDQIGIGLCHASPPGNCSSGRLTRPSD